MHSPFFSVIMPTYNRANMIGKAIKSVLAQTYTNWELLIVDDGSTDNTKQVVEAYHDPRIRYIYQQNAERSAARNKGIDNARGQYICFIDSDDYYLPNHLEGFANNLENNVGVGMLFGLNVIDRNGVLTNEGDRKTVADYNTIEEYFIVNPVRVAAVCVKRQALLQNKFDTKIRIGEDTELWVRIAKDYSVKFINSYTQVYVIHENQTVSEKNIQTVLQQIETLNYIFKNQNIGNRISKKIKWYILAECYFRLGQLNFLQKKYFKGVNYMLISTRYQPMLRLKEKIYLIITSAKF